MHHFPTAPEARVVAAEDKQASVAAEVGGELGRRAVRRLGRRARQQLVGRVAVVDEDNGLAEHADGADGAVEVLVRDPVLVLGPAAGRQVAHVA